MLLIFFLVSDFDFLSSASRSFVHVCVPTCPLLSVHTLCASLSLVSYCLCMLCMPACPLSTVVCACCVCQLVPCLLLFVHACMLACPLSAVVCACCACQLFRVITCLLSVHAVHASCFVLLPVSCLCMIVHASFFFHYEKSGECCQGRGPLPWHRP